MRSRDAASSILVSAIEGVTLSDDEKNFFEDERPAGVTLFKRNISTSFPQTKLLCNQVQSIMGGASPAVVAIDQEGGRVTRIANPFPNLGPAQHIEEGRSDPESLEHLHNYGFIVANSLLGMGINVNFAPVCDVNSNPQNKAIGDRAFSDDADVASLRALAYLRGLIDGGVQGCLKHFPGQGDAQDDTHLKGTVIDQPREVLEGRELLPFRNLIPHCAMVMISHAVFPAIDDQAASLSSIVMNDLLRKHYGFDGVIVTDDMNMKAIPQDEQSWGAAIVEAVSKGADMVLVCRELERSRMALRALRKEAASSPSFSLRLDDAAQRMAKLRTSLI